jgi:hypothetical protein
MLEYPNPYISRGPVRTAEMFFGRKNELLEIANFLRGDQSVSLVGPRKIGKTSLLFHLMRPPIAEELGLGSGRLVCYLDCEALGEESPPGVFQQFAAELIAEMESRGLPEAAELRQVCASPSRLAFEGALRALNRRGLRIVIILDEFERLSANSHLDVHFFNALRSMAGRFQLAYLTASASPLIALTYSGRSRDILSSPFFNIFAPLDLGLLPEADARDLIREPAQRSGRPFSPELQDFIGQLGGGHPLILQVACFHALERPEDRNGIKEQTSREMQSHFEYTWRNLAEDEKRLLPGANGLSVPDAQANADADVLRGLVQKCLLLSTHGKYASPAKAWSDFLAKQNSPPAAGSTGSILGRRLGPYEVLEPLGKGGMSEVYKARHVRLERLAAIKILPAQLALESDFRERFEREARAIALLKHSNIVQVYDFGDCDGMYYMAMEFIPGRDLAYRMNQSGKLPLAQVWWVANDLAAALDYAHARGIVHRDVKPSNVLLDPILRRDRPPPSAAARLHRAVLTDFGIVKLLEGAERSTRTGMFGTVDYMAPEQIRADAEIDGRADIYALGVMLFEMLTGRLPFRGDHPAAVVIAHLDTPPPDPRDFEPLLPESVALALQRAMTKNRDQRFSTAGEFIRAMR